MEPFINGAARGGAVDETVWEFYAPFAHLPGRLEWCRIRGPTHGVLDTCIVLGETAADPATVYVNSEAGERFMSDRFPECSTFRVASRSLGIQESVDRLRLHARLHADDGPLRRAEMAFTARSDVPRQVEYGGHGRPVWGGRFTCWGVDLEVDADVHGIIRWEGEREALAGTPGILTLGSMGRLEPLR